MLKSILLASAVMISAPALAQDMQDPQTPPTQEQPAPDTATEPVPQTPAPPEAETAPEPMPTPEPTPEPVPAPTPEPTATPEPQAAQQTAQATPAETPAQTGQQPANATQIAQIVDQGFPSYDKDADGSLKPEEFGSWMVALRSAGEPAFTGQSAADKEWIGRALAAADADQSGGVTKDELKSFLAPAAAS
ncbi:calcium-binding protein [Sphingomonas suaedae]|uniref:Calcium-binding protein n=1 Tax=Sphingomonas suaedae TaxID=2599297 RepID=A0A518RFY3_9SPHN|nr:calcium-binding protein [Sphingomonas suaedae]QDX26372.1 calcium-binding protein [Sphingomonas suaedae]